jgi:hypothetical protein
MRKLSSPLRHDAVRDTMWVGKGAGPAWLMIAGMVAVACLLAWWMH